MARLTKAQVARLSKASSTSRKATVEEVPESEDENDGADFIPAPHSESEELCDRFVSSHFTVFFRIFK